MLVVYLKIISINIKLRENYTKSLKVVITYLNIERIITKVELIRVDEKGSLEYRQKKNTVEHIQS